MSASLSAPGCTPTPATELIVVVDIEPTLAPALDRLSIDVLEPDGDVETTSITLADLGDARPTLGLRYRGGALETVLVDVTATGPGDVAVNAFAYTSFVAGERRLLRIALYDACRGVACADTSETCDLGGDCRSADRPGSSLPLFTEVPPNPFVDAGPRDTGTGSDAGPTDGGLPSRDECIYGLTCGLIPCIERGGVRVCSEGTLDDGATCAADSDCAHGACEGSTCMPRCRSNDSCSAGFVCLGDVGSAPYGACVPTAASPCAGCTAPGSACVADASGGTCVAGEICIYGVTCATGQECVLHRGALGGQGNCTAGTTCGEDMRMADASGGSWCAGASSCDLDTNDCGSSFPECVAPAEVGAPTVGRLGFCARRP